MFGDASELAVLVDVSTDPILQTSNIQSWLGMVSNRYSNRQSDSLLCCLRESVWGGGGPRVSSWLNWCESGKLGDGIFDLFII